MLEDPPRRIRIVEPHLAWQHYQVNAALVVALRQAFPDALVTFAARPAQIAWVQEAIELSDLDGAGIRWEPLRLAGSRLDGYPAALRPPADLAMVASTWLQSRAGKVDLLVMLSMTPYSWVAMTALHGAPQPFRSLVVPHAVVSTLAGGARTWRSSRAAGALADRLPSPRLTVLLFGAWIARSLAQRAPRLAARVASIDLPLIDAAAPAAPWDGSRAVLGHLGPSWNAAGRALDPALADAVLFAGSGIVLEPRELLAQLAGASHGLWTADPAHYAANTSASFLLALVHGRPVVYIRNAMTDYYEELLGDFGFACDSIEEVEATASALRAGFDRQRYRRQLAALEEHRAIFSPATAAHRLHTALTTPAAAPQPAPVP